MKNYDIENFKSKIDIIDVVSDDCTLSQDGSRLSGAHCTPESKSGKSLKIYLGQQSFYCFNCGVGGDVIAYVQGRDGCSFVDAMRWLSEKFNVPLPNWTPEEQAQSSRAYGQPRRPPKSSRAAPAGSTEKLQNGRAFTDC